MPKDLIKEIALEDETSSFRQGESRAAYLARRGIGELYGLVSEPLRASERLAERFRPRKLPQEMTEPELQRKIEEGPPTVGKAVGAVSDVVSDVASTVPIFGDDAIMAKYATKKLPMMLGTIAGAREAIELGSKGAVTKKGTPIIDNIFNWIKYKYENILYTRPKDGFPPGGAQGQFYIFKGQAPGTGIKVGNLESEMDFLRKLDPDLDEAYRIYNASPVLQDYLPKMYTQPRLGGQIMMVEQMKPMSWHEIAKLPITEQRTMFIKFSKHLERLEAEFEKHGISFFDDSVSNWGITREGKPQIMDIGGMGGRWTGQVSAQDRLLQKATHYFDDAAYPMGNLQEAGKLADNLKHISEKELGLPEFWWSMQRRFGGDYFHGRKPVTPKTVGSTKVVPDPGKPTSSFQRKADEILAAAEREGAPAGARTRGDTSSTLRRRIEMYESMEKDYMKRNPKASPLWLDDIKRVEAELRRRERVPDITKEISK